MASIARDPNGRRRIQFLAPDGKRKTIRLGKISQRNAESFKLRVELILTSLTLQNGLDGETARWIVELDDATHAKLAKVGLVEPRAERSQTLEGHIDSYLARRTEVKPRTQISWKQARKSLIDYFGAEKRLATVTVAGAKDWERWLATPEARGNLKDDEQKTGLAPNTIRKRVANAKLFFDDAVARELIPANPFKSLKGSVGANHDRDHFVTREVIEKVLDVCPDAEWRLIVALSRYGGLRCPSEHLALTIQDVDLPNSRLRVPSPKTEHHAGKAFRMIPLFPELKPFVEDVCELLEPGQTYLINRYRDTNANLRTRLLRIIQKAGVPVWEKLFQNMRASRATELADEFPEHVATAWIGHSVKVARQHYWQVTDDHFDRAIGGQEKAAQNPAQQALAGPGFASQANLPAHKKTLEKPGFANYRENAQNRKVGQAGLESGAESSGKTGVGAQGGAESGVVGAPGAEVDADLALVVAAWPNLADSAKARILSIVHSRPG